MWQKQIREVEGKRDVKQLGEVRGGDKGVIQTALTHRVSQHDVVRHSLHTKSMFPLSLFLFRSLICPVVASVFVNFLQHSSFFVL